MVTWTLVFSYILTTCEHLLSFKVAQSTGRPACVFNVELQKRHPRPGRVDVFAHITLLMQTGELDQAS